MTQLLKAPKLLISPKLRGGFAPPLEEDDGDYLLEENFEGAGYENAATETTPGTLDEDYTDVALEGSQSLRIANSVQPGRVQWTFTAAGDAYAHFLVRFVTAPGTGKVWFSLRDSANNGLVTLEFQASNTIRIRCGSQNATTTAGMSVDTTYHVWVRYTKGTGANAFVEVGFSTDGTKPAAGTNYASKANGTSTADAERVELGSSGNATWEAIFDRLLISTSSIGDNP